MTNYLPEVLISEDDIALRINDLAKAINEDFEGEELTVICILKGAFMFCSDLIKKVELPIKLEFMDVSSYGAGMTSSGEVKLNLDVETKIQGENVLIVEDIVDSGLTVKFLLNTLNAKSPKVLKLASLLYKPSKNKYPVDINYLGFEIDDKFVVGYGLDYAGRYREIPYIGVLNAGN